MEPSILLPVGWVPGSPPRFAMPKCCSSTTALLGSSTTIVIAFRRMFGARRSRLPIMSDGWPDAASRRSSTYAASRPTGRAGSSSRPARATVIKLVDLTLKSRAAPTRATLLAIKDLLATVEYPILVHCKSGADRAGLMSVIIRHVRDGLPISQAKDQLSFRYGHIRSADTGVLDAVFERYLEDEAKTGIAFWDWVENVYDPVEINRSFKARGWANRIVNGLLKRE